MSTAASFIDPIKTEYRDVVKAESGALPHAIKCGELLKLAKENLKAERGGKWKDWLETNCSEIAQETASLYMRLAEHKAKVNKAKSIREARELLPKQTRQLSQSSNQSDADQPNRSEESNRSFEHEVVAFAPDEVLDMLVEGWHDDDKLAQLAKLINDHLQKKSAAAAITRPTISNTVTNPTTARPVS